MPPDPLIAFACVVSLPIGRPRRKVNVIYVRFSSNLQRCEIASDQERRCRESLERIGISAEGFIVLSDEALSGKRDSQPGFD
jgi:hypothetical protein